MKGSFWSGIWFFVASRRVQAGVSIVQDVRVLMLALVTLVKEAKSVTEVLL